MIEAEDDFRISIAGAQEKTALLYLDDHWCLPFNITPTTHIIKLPIGKIESHSDSIDMSDSVENESLCMLIAKAFGLPVPHCFMIKAGKIKALVIERFDRKYASDGCWIMRLPQEDFCQILNVPSARKYENHGGPGISAIMAYLLGAVDPEKDRYSFMKTQVLFWLLVATDGHAKNFSLFIQSEGRYRLTPYYDILSMYPAMGGRGIDRLKRQEIRYRTDRSTPLFPNGAGGWVCQRIDGEHSNGICTLDGCCCGERQRPTACGFSCIDS